ncbi:MAG: alpha/beta hydrolase [Actinomycetota bacterium]
MQSAAAAAIRTWETGGRVAEIGGRRIFVLEAGDPSAAAIVLLHGFPSSSFDWRSVVPGLAEGARVVAFDFPGYGLSEKPFDGRYSLFEQADVAEAVVAAAGIERCVLVGHDMGDTVATELLARATEGRLGFEVERTILLNGSIFIDLAQLSPGQQALLSMPDEVLPQPMPLEMFRPGLAATFSEEHPASEEDLDGIVEMVRRSDGDRLLPRLIRYIEERRANQPRWTSGLVDHPAPLTLLWGARDPIAVVAMTERLRELRPSTEVVVWDDVGHWPTLEAPDRVVAEVRARR